MAIKKGHYLAYLLRIWQVNEAGICTWRASLENPHTGKRRGFASFDALIEFLKERISQDALESETGQENTSGG